MNAIIEQSRSIGAQEASTPAPAPVSSAGGDLPKLEELASLLTHAYQNEGGSDVWSGESERLIRCAAELAQDIIELVKNGEADIQNELYDVAALIKAALRVPGDRTGPERRSWLTEAGSIIMDLNEDPETMTDSLPPDRANAAELIVHGNHYGDQHFSGLKELKTFVRYRADLIASLSVCFQQVVLHVDDSFHQDYFEHLNDLIYQQQTATTMLLDANGEKA